MLRFHVHRLIFAVAVLGPLITGGLLLGAAQADRHQETGFTVQAEPASEPVADIGGLGRESPRRIRSAELNWTFFSFGRRGTF